VASEVWDWLARRRWLVSVNSRGAFWSGWLPVLEKLPQLRLLVSHLGLPGATDMPLDAATARARLAHVLALAQYPGTHVKLSGFYALTRPAHDYPHRAAWPYVQALVEDFGTQRLLWGSDFSPSLEFVSFPQTYGLLSHMPFLSPHDRQLIEGRNLTSLLEAADVGIPGNR
jgi:L-fuconolactonase